MVRSAQEDRITEVIRHALLHVETTVYSTYIILHYIHDLVRSLKTEICLVRVWRPTDAPLGSGDQRSAFGRVFHPFSRHLDGPRCGICPSEHTTERACTAGEGAKGAREMNGAALDMLIQASTGNEHNRPGRMVKYFHHDGF